MKRDTLFRSLTIYLKCSNTLSNSNLPSPTKNVLCLRHILFGKKWLKTAHFSTGFAMNMKECSLHSQGYCSNSLALASDPI